MKQFLTTVTIMMLVSSAAWAVQTSLSWDYTQPYTADPYTMLLLHFDESAGSTYGADSSGGGYDAVLAIGNVNGSDTTASFDLDPFETWVASQAGFGNCAYSYHTDDTNNNVGSMVITDNGDLSAGTADDWTFEFWMNPDGPGGSWGSRILKHQTGSDYHISFNSGNLSFGWYKGGWLSVTDSSTIAIDTWTHVAIIVDNSTLDNPDTMIDPSIISFYLNGELSSSHTTSDTEGAGNYNTGPLQLFNDATGIPGLYLQRQFTGKLDEVRISAVNRFNVGPLPIGTDLDAYDWQSPHTNDTWTMLLMHFDETPGSTVAMDSGGDTAYNFTLTTGNTNASTGAPFDLDPNATWVTSQAGFGNCAYSWYEDDTNNNVGPMVYQDSTADLSISGDQNYTFEFWMNPDDDGSGWGSRIFKNYTGGPFAIGYGDYAGNVGVGHITFGWYKGGWLSVTDTYTTIPLGEWTHVAIIVINDKFIGGLSELRFYYNGTLSSIHLTGAISNTAAAGVSFFNDNHVTSLETARQFRGKLDEVRMSNTNRSEWDGPDWKPEEPELQSEWWKPFEVDSGTRVLMHFDEATGNTAHDSAANPIFNDGTLGLGGTTFFDDRSSDTNIPHAVFKRSLGHFDGTVDGTVVIPHSADLNCTRAVTLEAWIYPTNWGGANRNIIEKHYSAALDPPTKRKAAYSLNFWYTQLQGTVVSSNGSTSVYTRLHDYQVPENDWSHVAMSYDADLWPAVRLFINGTEVTAEQVLTGNAASFDILQNQGPLLIGGVHTSGGPWYRGYIDEVRVSNVGREFIKPDPTPNLIIEQVTNDVDLSWTSAEGGIYLVQTTTDLTQPWEQLLGVDGSFNLSYYTHVAAGVDQERFYRVNLFEPVSMGYATIAEKAVTINGLINEWTDSEKIATRDNFFNIGEWTKMSWFQMDVYGAVDTTGDTDALIFAWETDYLGATDVIEIQIMDPSDSNAQYQIAFDSFGQMTSYIGNASGINQRPGGTGGSGDFILVDFQAAGGVFQDAKFSGKWSGEIKIPYDFMSSTYTFDPSDQRSVYFNRAAFGNTQYGTTNPEGAFWSWGGGPPLVYTEPNVGVTR